MKRINTNFEGSHPIISIASEKPIGSPPTTWREPKKFWGGSAPPNPSFNVKNRKIGPETVLLEVIFSVLGTKNASNFAREREKNDFFSVGGNDFHVKYLPLHDSLIAK